MSVLRRLTPEDLPRLNQFWLEHWGGDFMVTRGTIYRPEQLEGFVIEDGDEWVGLLTYFVKDGEMEVTSLDSLREGQGLGSQSYGGSFCYITFVSALNLRVGMRERFYSLF